MRLSLRDQRIIDQARESGQGFSFHVSKVDRRRWNWQLSIHYMERASASSEYYPTKFVMFAGNDYDKLEAMRAELERQFRNTADLSSDCEWRT